MSLQNTNKFAFALAYAYRWPAALDTLARQNANKFAFALAYAYLCTMKAPSSHLPGATAIVFAAIVLLFVPWLGETLFYSKGEPREAIVAVSILQSGDWILPVNYGADIPFKPPFMAWLIAVFAMLFNGGTVGEFVSRLPSALAAVSMLMGGYCWARRVRDTRFAVIFTFVTATSFEVFRAAMACRVDMLLMACSVGAIYVMYDLRERRGRQRALRYAAAWLLLACASLTKGPVGSLLPCLAMGIYCLLRRDRFWPTLGRMLVLALSSLIPYALWAWAAYARGGDDFLALALEENTGRLTGTMSYSSHVKPVWYNAVTLLCGLLPWTLMALISTFSARRLRRGPMKEAGLLALTVSVVVIAFYCIPESKRSVYLLPAYPFVCYGLTSLVESIAAKRGMRVFTWLMAVVAVLVPLLFAAAVVVRPGQIVLAPLPWWAWPVLALPAVAGVAWMCNRHSPVGHVIVIVWSIYLAYTAAAMPAVLNPRSDRRALPDIPAGAAVYSLEDDHRLYSLNFYLDDAIRTVPDMESAVALPAGSVLIVHEQFEPGIPREFFDVEVLIDRSADHRRRLYKAVRKSQVHYNIKKNYASSH